ncbi:lytic transglycosylase domain-containing protein [Campylobacter volucris]|uniref:lytic transglycosylase domain-containing protein n=1 Tax=Campylobacter volucris TaxID=1031542 RepID=UPI00189F9274|nr:lytic transglycosylase domain-containing protein [Campylobacter volucris]MBF7049794.1 lytic transglycosylase domain-containing protein [Campylobacter volucris]MBF7060952.1 lytic transglycosylase domain-containing protein [Campylobacter volucris]
MIQKLLLFFIFQGIVYAYETKIFVNDTYIPENFYKYDKDFKNAAKKYNIPVFLLKAIALTENASFEHDSIGINKNKTKDYGLMQINSIHLKRYGISKKDIQRVCVNIDTAARLLYEIIQKHGFNWDAIGRYHSSNEKYKNIWLNKVAKNFITVIFKDINDLIVVEKIRVTKLMYLLLSFNEKQYLHLANN